MRARSRAIRTMPSRNSTYEGELNVGSVSAAQRMVLNGRRPADIVQSMLSRAWSAWC